MILIWLIYENNKSDKMKVIACIIIIALLLIYCSVQFYLVKKKERFCI